MEALRFSNLEALRASRRFQSPESGSYRVIEVFAYGDCGSRLIESQKTLDADVESLENLVTFLKRERPDGEGNQATASLQLVEIYADAQSVTINSAEHLKQVLDAMKIDLALLSSITRPNLPSIGTFFELTELAAWSVELEPYNAWSYMTIGYMLWSYVAEDLSTRAVLFRHHESNDILPHLQQLSTLIYHPLSLNIICLIWSLNLVDAWLISYAGNLWLVENETGYTYAPDLRMEKPQDKLGLGEMSKMVGSLATGLHNTQATLKALRAALAGSGCLSTRAKPRQWHGRVPAAQLAVIEKVSEEVEMIGRIKAAHTVLLVDRCTEHLDRAGVQLNVVSEPGRQRNKTLVN